MTTIPALPHRMTPVDVLAREIHEAVAMLGPDPVCLDALERICNSRPVLVRQSVDHLLDIGLVTAAPSGCLVLASAA